MMKPTSDKKSGLPRILPIIGPWLYDRGDSGTIGASVGLSVGAVVAGIIAWLGFPLVGGLVGAALLMLVLRIAS